MDLADCGGVLQFWGQWPQSHEGQLSHLVAVVQIPARRCWEMRALERAAADISEKRRNDLPPGQTLVLFGTAFLGKPLARGWLTGWSHSQECR